MPTQKSTLPLSEAPKPTYNHTPENIEDLCQNLAEQLFTNDTTICFSKSKTRHSFAQPHESPAAVFRPRTTEEVSAIAKACHERNIAITSYGGGTSLGGALAATRGGICIDFQEMNKIIQVHEDDLDIVVQPNVGWVELNQYLDEKNLFFPPDPAPGAKIGGMIAMGCSGTNAYRYGTMKDWVLSLTLVLADGTIVKTRNRPRKSSAGYDLTNLIIGSEGTLALVTEAVLKLTALPKNLHVGLAVFETMAEGVSVAIAIMKSGTVLEAIELMDAAGTHSVNTSKLVPALTLLEKPTLFLKFSNPSPQTVTEQIALVRSICDQHHSLSFEASGEKERIDTLWAARKCLGNSFMSMKKDETDVFIHTDACVPLSNLARLVAESEALIAGTGWFCCNMAHAGDGNTHTAIVAPLADKAAVEELLSKIQRLALELEGTITGEHGVGLKLRDLLVEEVGKEGVDVMRGIKGALDPKGLLNPDKIIRLESDV
ncbi:hypothetical protein BDV96DRAFT_603764 [Lophiotrema nucula]|uniref:D-lactate dehydrogenase (cytochrome) n=1 Tax=Lophiotrema nucula TaxID=690887 RepID=A0A6A5YX22_9PLEO|nr:hypothetical protein BDV96DRAFT_603764 [Lophiotrema nucula]